eukprot:Skav226174  [mRNA]  locus=scaffold1708:77312:79125:- [translate_table: standard]
MLNTGLHVAAKKLGNKAKGASMSLEEYIANTRLLAVVNNSILRFWAVLVAVAEKGGQWWTGRAFMPGSLPWDRFVSLASARA